MKKGQIPAMTLSENTMLDSDIKQVLRSNLVECLFKQLTDSKLDYCFWKSTGSLDKAYLGDADFDLLIDRQSFPLMDSILLNLGFKPAEPRWSTSPPGIFHYFGCDPDKGNFIHIHLFCQVLTGESIVKSHLLPISRLLLENTIKRDGIRLVSKEAELVVFILRHFIKLGSIPDLLLLFRGWQDIFRELDALIAGVDLAKSVALLDRYCPVVSGSLFLACIDSLRSRRSVVALYKMALKVRRRLSGYRIYSRCGTWRAYFGWVLAMARRRLNGNRQDKRLRTGGILIAFVGPDAVGKTTLVNAAKSWLQKVFPTRCVHAGRPPTSLLTAPLNILIRSAEKFRSQVITNQREENLLSTHPGGGKSLRHSFLSILYALRSVSLAWDRYRILVKSKRLAARGEIVLCDRYPSTQVGAMDSPRLKPDPNLKGLFARLFNALVQMEANIYQCVPPPDIVLRLKASVEIAQRRNQARFGTEGGDDELLYARHNLGYEWYSPCVDQIHDIDTENPLDETLFKVKRVIWDSI